ncbi:MAG TPA: hypothetical protein VIY47_15945, partial [Ignavibacteriaceae bacterium]
MASPSVTIERLNKEAAEAGLELIGVCDDPLYRVYKWEKCGHTNKYSFSNIRRKNVRCQECIDEKQKTEAKKVGLELIGSGNKKGFRLYRWKICGHEKEYDTGSVRKGSVRCTECFEELYRKEANLAGLILLGPGSSSGSRSYKRISCDHINEYRLSFVREKTDGNVYCPNCDEIKKEKTKLAKEESDKFKNNFEKRILEEAKNAGLELIGYSGKDSHRLYKRISCGHISEYHLSSVRRYRETEILCHECVKENHIKEAKQAGLIILGSGKTSSYLKYQRIICGHICDYSVFEVKRQKINCKQCFEEKCQDEAASAGLKIIGPSNKKSHKKYCILACGHTTECSFTTVRNSKDKKFLCFQCVNERLIKEADAAGLVLLGPGKINKNYKLYRWKLCGHEREYGLKEIRNTTVSCKVCTKDKHKLEAAAAGLELIGPGKDAWHRTYKILDCEHINEYKLNEVRNKNICCSVCFYKKL